MISLNIASCFQLILLRRIPTTAVDNFEFEEGDIELTCKSIFDWKIKCMDEESTCMSMLVYLDILDN